MKPRNSSRYTQSDKRIDCVVCCIYHKPKVHNFEDPFADSSSESSEGSDSDDSSVESDGEEQEGENGVLHGASDHRGQGASRGGIERQSKKASKKLHRHTHKHAGGCNDEHGRAHLGTTSPLSVPPPPPNAYEHQPRYGKFKASKRNKEESSTMTIQE